MSLSRSFNRRSLAAGSMLDANPRASPRANRCLLSAPAMWLSAFLIVPTFVVCVTVPRPSARSSAWKKYSSHQPPSWPRSSSGCFDSQPLTMREGSTASSDRNSIAVRDTVAGDANLRSSHSKMKLTFEPNWMRSPEGRVSRRLSSRTEFSDSIHSGSTSPSQMIQLC